MNAKQVVPLTPAGEESYRRELRVWMRQVIATKRLNPESWARESEVAGSTIRRFLNGGPESPTPSLDTISKLADVAGVGPSMKFGRIAKGVNLGTTKVRLIAPDLAGRLSTMLNYQALFSEIESSDFISVDEGLYSTMAYAVEIEHESVNQLGVFKGDIAIVEPIWSKAPKTASFVLVEDFTQVMVMTYHQPTIIPRSTDPTYEPRPIDDVTILGTLVEVRRRFF